MRAALRARIATAGVFIVAIACSSNSARTDEAGAAPRDSTGLETAATSSHPSGYSGMERDTTGGTVQQTPVDTFLQQQGTNPAADTAGYSGIERNDTSAGSAEPGNVQGHGQNPAPAQTQPAPADSTVLPSDSGALPGGINDSTGADSTGTGTIDSTSTGTNNSTSQQR